MKLFSMEFPDEPLGYVCIAEAFYAENSPRAYNSKTPHGTCEWWSSIYGSEY
jgi:hypothetical protein